MSEQKQYRNEDSTPVFGEVVDKIVDWMSDETLPLWLKEGVDRTLSTAYISLFSSAERSGPPRAVLNGGWQGIAQAQIVYILSQSQHLGWLSVNESCLVEGMIEFSGRHGVLPCRSDGFVHHLNSDLSIADSKRLLLDHAYFMMASTASFVAFGVGNDLRRAYNIMHWIDIKMTHPQGGWCHEYGALKAGSSDAYLQCLHAFLYLFEVTRKPCWIERASVVYDLFVENFYDPENSSVHKNMIDLAEGMDGEQDVVAASELFCWVWLLRRYQNLMGEMAGDLIDDIANQLYAHAKQSFNNDSGRFESKLIATYILASSFQAQAGCEHAESEFIDAVTSLQQSYISNSIQGWCVDDVSSKIFSTNSFFYIFEAIREAYLYINPEKREVPLREVGGL